MKGSETLHCAVRLDMDLIKKLDAFVRIMMKASPGIRWSRSTAIRVLLLRGLDSYDRAQDF